MPNSPAKKPAAIPQSEHSEHKLVLVEVSRIPG